MASYKGIFIETKKKKNELCLKTVECKKGDKEVWRQLLNGEKIDSRVITLEGEEYVIFFSPDNSKKWSYVSYVSMKDYIVTETLCGNIFILKKEHKSLTRKDEKIIRNHLAYNYNSTGTISRLILVNKE